jgi:uncharacterized small protein (DUF1192 family)
MSQIKYYWEDLEPGSVRELGRRRAAAPEEIAQLEAAARKE